MRDAQTVTAHSVWVEDRLVATALAAQLGHVQMARVARRGTRTRRAHRRESTREEQPPTNGK